MSDPSLGTSRLTIDLIQEEEAFLALAPEWDSLLQRSSSDSFFLCWSWVSSWWRAFGGRRSLHLLAARDTGGRLCGVAPLMVAPGTGRVGRSFRYLMFIGQDRETFSEYLDFFVEKGREEQITPELCRYLLRTRRSSWDLLQIEPVVSTSPNLPLIRSALSAAGMAVDEHARFSAPYRRLPDEPESLKTSKSTHFRRRWNHYVNRLSRQGEVRFLFAGTDLPVERAMSSLTELNRARWGDEGSSFRSAEYCRFHAELSEKLAQSGCLLLVLMSVGDRIVAARYDFLYGGKIWSHQGGWQKDYARMGAAFVLLGRIMEWGVENGYREYDFLIGEEAYKSRWSSDRRQLIGLTAYPSDWRARLLRLGTAAKAALRRFAH